MCVYIQCLMKIVSRVCVYMYVYIIFFHISLQNQEEKSQKAIEIIMEYKNLTIYNNFNLNKLI